jgi:hypothetical protein
MKANLAAPPAGEKLKIELFQCIRWLIDHKPTKNDLLDATPTVDLHDVAGQEFGVIRSQE